MNITDYASYIHEIKNSLNIISGMTHILDIQLAIVTQNNNNPDDLFKTKNILNDMKVNMDTITESIRTIKSLEADFEDCKRTGMQSLHYETIDLSAVMMSVIHEQSELFSKKNIKIIQALPKCKVYTDALKIKCILQNILSNALKYSPSDTTIDIMCYNTNTETFVRIKDNGIGMSKNELKSICTPFYRCKRMNVDGTGLGLAIVKKLCDRLGCQLQITSELNKGTTVVIVFNHVKR